MCKINTSTFRHDKPGYVLLERLLVRIGFKIFVTFYKKPICF